MTRLSQRAGVVLFSTLSVVLVITALSTDEWLLDTQRRYASPSNVVHRTIKVGVVSFDVHLDRSTTGPFSFDCSGNSTSEYIAPQRCHNLVQAGNAALATCVTAVVFYTFGVIIPTVVQLIRRSSYPVDRLYTLVVGSALGGGLLFLMAAILYATLRPSLSYNVPGVMDGTLSYGFGYYFVVVATVISLIASVGTACQRDDAHSQYQQSTI